MFLTQFRTLPKTLPTCCWRWMLQPGWSRPLVCCGCWESRRCQCCGGWSARQGLWVGRPGRWDKYDNRNTVFYEMKAMLYPHQVHLSCSGELSYLSPRGLNQKNMNSHWGKTRVWMCLHMPWCPGSCQHVADSSCSFHIINMHPLSFPHCLSVTFNNVA